MKEDKRLILVPMKDPSEAKTRLSTCLSASARADLALGLFRQTMTRVTKIAAQHECVSVAVVTRSASIRKYSASFGAQVIAEPSRAGLNAALEHAADWATRQGYTSLCILPADLAAPKSEDLSELIAYPLSADQAILCPSSDHGTNAFLMPLPMPFAFAYGALSFHAHYAAAEAAGLTPIVARWPSLEVDIDREGDLLQYRPAVFEGAAE